MFAITIAAVIAAAECTYANPQVTVTPPSSGAGIAGRTEGYTVTVTNMNSVECAATSIIVTLTAPATLPDGWSLIASPTSFPLASGAMGSTQVQIASPLSAPAGSYAVAVVAYQYPKFNYFAPATATYVVNAQSPDFSISSNPPSVTVQQGSSGGVTISTSISGGFNSLISLWAVTPFGVTPNFQNAIIAAPGTGSTTLTFIAAANATPGTTLVPVTGMGGAITHTVNVSLTITSSPPVQTGLFISPADPSVPNGTPQQFLASAVYSNNTTQDVTTQANWTSTTGSVAQIGPATGLATTLSPGSTTIGASYGGFNASTTLTVTAVATCVHKAPAIEVTPASSPSVAPGTLVSFNVKITDVEDPVCGSSRYLLIDPTPPTSAPNGWTFSFGKTAFNLTAGQSDNTTLQMSSPTNLASGSYDVTVRAVYWPIYTLETDHLATYVVNSLVLPDFAVGVNPASISAQKGGSNATTAASVTLFDGYNHSLTLGTSALPTGVHVSFNPPTLPAPGSGTSTVTVSADNTASLGPVTFDVTATDGTTTHSAPLTVTVTNTPPTLIGISVSTTTPSVAVGGTAQFNASALFSDNSSQDVTGVASWDTTDHTVATVNSTGLVSTLKPGSINVSAGYQGQSGSAPFTVTAPAGCTLVNPTVAITPSTSPILPAGQLQNYSVSLKNNNTGCGTVTLLLRPLPAPPDGWTEVLQDISFQLSDGATGLTTLQVRSPNDAPAGSQDIWVTGLNWPNFNYRQQTKTEYVIGSTNSPGFSVSTVQNAITIQQGGVAGTINVTVSPLNGFTAPVGLTVLGLPSGVTPMFLPSPTIFGGSGSVTLNLTAAANATLGTVAITIQGTSGAEVETAVVNLTVSASPPSLIAISVLPATPTVPAGSPPIQFTASALYSNSTSQDLTGLATWSSDNNLVATVNSATGLATIVGPGTANITASYSAHSGSTLLTVSNATACVRSNPTLTVIPLMDGPGPAGRTVIYSVSLRDNDSAGCATSRFLIRAIPPDDTWNIFIASNFILGPGQTGYTTLQVTSPITQASGGYAIQVQGFAWPVFTYLDSTTVYYLIQ